jgi:hypothetical protein
MHAMKGVRLFIAIPLLVWVLLSTSCKEDPVTPALPTLTAEEQLLFFLEDSNLFTTTSYLDDHTYYFRLQDTIPGDTGTLDHGPVIYFHYSLAFISAAINELYPETDSAMLDTVLNYSPYHVFDFNEPSLVGRLGADAFWPVGLDRVLQSTSIKEGETYVFYLPPGLSYGGIPLNSASTDKPVEIGIRIDSIKSVGEIYEEARININQYIIDAELRDTSVVAGGPVTVLSGLGGEPVFFKRLSPITSGISPLIGQDSVEINFTYHFVQDSLNNGGLGALETATTIPIQYNLLMDMVSTISGLQTGIFAMRTGETALLIFGPGLAYRESICFVPDLRTGGSFYGDREGNTTFQTKKYLLDNKVVPGYAFQTEPYRSYVFRVNLVRVYR